MNNSKLKQLEYELNKPGINPAFKFLLSGAGSIPLVGGLVSGSLTLASDEALEEVHKKLLVWAKDAEDRIDLLLKQIELLTPEQPSKATLALLLGELFGDKLSHELILKAPSEIPVLLNNASINDFDVYISKGWVKLIPTHSQVSLGCGNKLGNYIEEVKRPYGNGSSFKLQIIKTS
ncbi:hypothetical protein [Acinetobacter baumannii]|uniref:hypothetical protein n=1 Tax=Acinetobacter baumannii TaxID=470 RepID=UPI003B434F36